MIRTTRRPRQPGTGSDEIGVDGEGRPRATALDRRTTTRGARKADLDLACGQITMRSKRHGSLSDIVGEPETIRFVRATVVRLVGSAVLAPRGDRRLGGDCPDANLQAGRQTMGPSWTATARKRAMDRRRSRRRVIGWVVVGLVGDDPRCALDRPGLRGVTRIVTVAVSLLDRLPRLHATVGGSWVQLPWEARAEPSQALSGSVIVTMIPVAVDAPSLATVMV